MWASSAGPISARLGEVVRADDRRFGRNARQREDYFGGRITKSQISLTASLGGLAIIFAEVLQLSIGRQRRIRRSPGSSGDYDQAGSFPTKIRQGCLSCLPAQPDHQVLFRTDIAGGFTGCQNRKVLPITTKNNEFWFTEKALVNSSGRSRTGLY